MEQASWLIVGLGNPGRQYAQNWHNSGYQVVEILAQRHKIAVSRVRCKGLLGQGIIGGQKCLLLKPTTYMNLSGQSVQAALSYYKVPPERCIVVYDDVDIAAGQVRIRERGSAGTHNGMRSIVGELGREDFPRVRVGIGPQPQEWDIADFVLSDIPEASREIIWEALNKAADAVETIVGEGLAKAMNQYNNRK